MFGSRRTTFNLVLVVWLALGLQLASCGKDSGYDHRVRSLEEIKKSGKLVVITRNAPTTYYIDRDGEKAGIEYDMVVSFARYIGVEPEFKMIPSIAGILEAVDEGKGDIAAAGLTNTPGRSGHFQIGPVYQRVRQLVVARRGGIQPRSIDELAKAKLVVVAGSSHEERLVSLRADHPDLAWESNDSLDAEQLLEEVWLGEIDCTVADDNIFRINRRYFPELVATMSTKDPEPLAWFLQRNSRGLRKAINKWFEGFSESGELQLLLEKYYGYVELFDYVDTRKFARRIHTRLPKFISIFQKAAEDNGLDWTLLAAQSYQESHWRSGAQSPTGVKGIMMLTLSAAEDVGVTDRLDPQQSIEGGAQYLRGIIERLPREIAEPDRTWIALAAYNVGMGHMYDARALARRLGRDPNRWIDLQEVFPLLAQKQYYQTVKHGYARGGEPVRYVSGIRNYEDILQRSLQ